MDGFGPPTIPVTSSNGWGRLWSPSSSRYKQPRMRLIGTFNSVTAINSWPTTVLFLMGQTTDDECYQQIAVDNTQWTDDGWTYVGNQCLSGHYGGPTIMSCCVCFNNRRVVFLPLFWIHRVEVTLLTAVLLLAIRQCYLRLWWTMMGLYCFHWTGFWVSYCWVITNTYTLCSEKYTHFRFLAHLLEKVTNLNENFRQNR